MNYNIIISLALLIFVSCENIQNKDPINKESQLLQSLLDKSAVYGTILIYDSNKNIYYSNNFNEAKRSSIPASTYKIPHTIIGLETGELKDEKTVFKWNGEKRNFKIWEQDLTLKQAFQKSCVPCYQELARRIGAKRMKAYLEKLSFGRMCFNDKTIDNFWLTGKSEINPLEQIDFLKRLYNKKLNISESTHKTIKNILIIEEKKNYSLSGKTGFANNIGWFVGYLEKEENTFYFATRISQQEANNMSTKKFLSIRKSVTIEALQNLGIIK